MPPLQIPILPTLHQLPSWCNLRGNIDRSACVEVRLAELRRLAGCYETNTSKRGRRGTTWRKAGATKPLPNEKPARNRHGRVATGVITISARMVAKLHDTRRPRTLAGDWRTNRAHVMRPRRFDPSKGFKIRGKRNTPFLFPYDNGLDANPNKGASRQKMIGLLHEWSQPLRIEKWIFPKRIQPAYYLVCPGTRHACVRHSALGIRHSSSASTRMPHPDCQLPALAPLSTCPPGRKATGCPQRCLKLLMVLCTEAEARDADIAQLWIESIPPSLRPHFREQINTLTARYGPIMHPRTLLCPRCLGVAYGNNPETVRQGWRRRNNKPNTNPSTVITTRVTDRMSSVNPMLCTPQAGEVEKQLRDKARHRNYNRKRKAYKRTEPEPIPEEDQFLSLVDPPSNELLQAMAASKNLRAMIALGETVKKEEKKDATT